MSSTPYTSLLPQRSNRNYTIAALAVGLVLIATGTYHQRERLPSLRLDALAGQRYCTNDELSVGHGRWEQVEIDAHTWPRLKQSVGYTCSDNRHALMCFTNDATQLPRLAASNSWRWKPEGCTLRPFDAKKLIRRLGDNSRKGKAGRGLLFVGDSLQLQHVQSFECLMGQYVEEGFMTDKEVNGLLLGEAAGRLDFVRSDYIAQPENDYEIIMPETEEPEDIGRFVRKWSHLVEDKEFVVLNTGAHWGGMTVRLTSVSFLPPSLELTVLSPSPSPSPSSPALHVPQDRHLELYHNVAQDVISLIDQFEHVTLIVRGSVPGHVNCSQYSAPLLEADSGVHAAYNWQAFEHYNKIWKDLLEQHPRHQFLDVSATSLRGDGHRLPDTDCLHYCLPGPVDTWNTLLYHIIMGL
ncbi:GDSL/SGNH-like acyl-esterase family found in Pmr5 and Cas1p-domain-containing protein [Leucosporidium creatinivorum]|uniref:GDSL/SGNH-like acyl-esterase family found in Pmr5 and Cas1p-domain-containing protein n=1 Tax=Leucosporidium creatinivorum TaxID=106004 RepID=A0A1Y2FBM2_9BASI|nr:GDSL/SGNH-like acyl-esterase family found in Pmr5 and Cas1p-domain-containing protein [Leucosporidium creatinivorum]